MWGRVSHLHRLPPEGHVPIAWLVWSRYTERPEQADYRARSCCPTAWAGLWAGDGNGSDCRWVLGEYVLRLVVTIAHPCDYKKHSSVQTGELYGVRILSGNSVWHFFKKEQQLCEEMFGASWAVQGILMEVEGRGGQRHFLALVYCHIGHKCSLLPWQRTE